MIIIARDRDDIITAIDLRFPSHRVANFDFVASTIIRLHLTVHLLAS